MAYRVSMAFRCQQPRCPKRASEEVRNRFNELIGRFCIPHAKQREKVIQAGEDELHRRQVELDQSAHG